MTKLVEDLTGKEALESALIAARDYRKHKIRVLELNENQGCSSTTFVVDYEDQTKSIIQLRNDRIDTILVSLAHGILGDIVPLVRAVKASHTMFAYGMRFIQGSRWEPLIITSLKEDMNIAGQLGSILAKCRLGGTTSEAIINYTIVPRLESIIRDQLPSLEDKHPRLRGWFERLLARAPNVKRLPLTLTHIDVNPFNVIVDESSPPQIVGLIDWQGATILPFAMNAYQIRLIAVLNRQGIDCPDSTTATPIATAFWQTLTQDIDTELKGAVLDAMSIGMILFCDFHEDLGIPPERILQNTVARLDWLEEIYRPLCK
ncbi:SubName: Full=Uncharacterized protein {ECO:0000313/EMBL:CCA72780.1} [Serendipita indica DSM 11827]|nr:SubName: Full=Uncharacterized protein {ECO:0000313/EMBL:CCA72780.1} [Serendipita indica DSM 11827]